MIHRHLEIRPGTPPDKLPAAAVLDILERGDLDAWKNHAPLVFALLRNVVESRGGPKIDDDKRPLVLLERRHRIHDTIRAHFLGILGLELQARLDARLDHDGIEAESPSAHFLQRVVHLRNHARDARPRDGVEGNAFLLKPHGEEDAQFVRGAIVGGDHAPMTANEK